jgi:hypothetical protein
MGFLNRLTQALDDLHQVAQGHPAQPSQQSSYPKLAPYQITGEFASVVLDGSGNGTARISPGQPAAGNRAGGGGIPRNSGYSWNVDAISVSVSTNSLEAVASAYVSYGIQSSSPSELVGSTVTGSTGDTCVIGAQLRPGDWISVAWKGGDPGATATLHVQGTVNPVGS